MEEKVEVKTIRVDYRCPKCNDGFMRATGIVFPMIPPAYPHKCNKCDHSQTFEKTYPCVEYQDVNLLTNV